MGDAFTERRNSQAASSDGSFGMQLARRLSDAELFLLIESEAFPKSDSQRAFPRTRFHSPSIMKRMEGGRRAVDAAVDGLVKKKFLAPLGDMVHATKNGNLVKHAFKDVRSSLSLGGATAAEVRALGFCKRLRQEMKKICKEKD